MSDQWIQREITDGIARLLTLSLDRTPANDAIDGTVNTWCAALHEGRVWDEHRDAWRFRAAFRRLGRECARWPSPSQFLTMLPPARALPKLARPKPNPEVARRAMAEALEILGGGEAINEERRHAPQPLADATKVLLQKLDRQQARRLRQQQGEDDAGLQHQ